MHFIFMFIKHRIFILVLCTLLCDHSFSYRPRPEDELGRGLSQNDSSCPTVPLLWTPYYGDSDVDMVMLVTESLC